MLKRGFQFAPGYRLQEFLGRGQFGQVWRATAPGGTAAAIKFIDLTDGQGQKEYDGVKRVKQINHANLMPITAIWLLDGQGQVIEEAPDDAIQTIDLSVQEGKGQSAMFIPKEVEPSWLAVAMLLGGKSLQRRLRDCVEEGLGGIPPKELVRYMDESAKGLDFLNTAQHDLGEGPVAIQHCDVKPANIVLIGDSAVVCDFGLARILTRNQVTATSAAGTPAYMAPEAISGKPSKTSDQYSLAVTYYHLRTGTLPVSDGSLWEVLDAHRRGKLSLGLVSEAEQEVLRKATDLDWKKRFDSNIDLVDALRDALRAGGHTQPSFVSRAAAAAGQNTGFTAPVAGTQPAADDPTATYGTQIFPSPASPQQAFERTAPVIQAEEQTNAEIAADTLESLPAETPAKQLESVLDVAKRNPKAIFAGVGGLLLLGLVYMLFPNGDSPAPPVVLTGGGDNGGNDNDQLDGVGKSPAEILNNAMTMLNKDEKSAVTLATKAIADDPSLAEMQPLPLSPHAADVISAFVTPDGKRLVTVAYDETPLLWNLDQATPQSKLNPTKLVGHPENENIEAATTDPKGERLLTGGWSGHAFIWDLQHDDVPKSRLDLEKCDAGILSVAWHPTEPIVVIATDDSTIHLFKLGNATSTQPNGTFTSKTFATDLLIKSIAIDPTGKWLVANSDSIELDQPVRVVAFRWSDVAEVFNVDGAPSPITVTAEGSVAECLAFARGDAEESLLVTGDQGGSLSMWKFTEGTDKLHDRVASAHTPPVLALRVVQVGDSDLIVSGGNGGSVRVQTIGATSENKTQTFGSAPISALDVSADGRWIVIGTKATPNDDGKAWLWDSSANIFQAIQLNFGSSSVTTVRLSEDGKWIIVGRKDGSVQLWDQQKAKLLLLSLPISPPSSKPVPVMEVDSPQITRL